MRSLWVSYVSELTLIGNLSYTVPNSSASADGSRSGHIWISTGIHCDYHALANPALCTGMARRPVKDLIRFNGADNHCFVSHSRNAGTFIMRAFWDSGRGQVSISLLLFG
jgi:hypothetical protein